MTLERQKQEQCWLTRSDGRSSGKGKDGSRAPRGLPLAWEPLRSAFKKSVSHDSTQWGNMFQVLFPAPTPNRRSRLSGIGYNGVPCPLRRLAVGGF
jgi:hypothetical protein